MAGMTIHAAKAADLPTLVASLPEGQLALAGPRGAWLPITGEVERSSAQPGSVLVEHPLGSLYLEDEDEVELVAPLTRPLTQQQAQDLADETNHVTVAVALSLDDLMEHAEDVLDRISEAVTGSTVLTAFTFDPMGTVGGPGNEKVVLRVRGDISDAY